MLRTFHAPALHVYTYHNYSGTFLPCKILAFPGCAVQREMLSEKFNIRPFQLW